MKKFVISALIVALVLVATISFVYSSPGNYVKIPQYTHSHTKAFCNSENLCQDYEIFCENKKAISISPITGAMVQFPEDWKDPRNEEDKEMGC